MKQTLLELCQTILSDMSSDEVNSIGDTSESMQVANSIRETYFNMLSRYNLPEHDQLFQLESSDDYNQPVVMYVPKAINRIDWISYFNSNAMDGSNVQTDQYGAYSQHDVNTDLQNNANGWSTTSTTSNTLGTGIFTFTVGTGLNISIGDTAFAQVNPASSGIMSGIVTNYSGTTLVLSINKFSGTGTYTAWGISQANPVSAGPGYSAVKVLTLEKFLHRIVRFDPTESDVGTFKLVINNVGTGNDSSYVFYYKNNQQPQNCCVISNSIVVFDAYDNTQDSTLQSAKTMCHGWVLPTFRMEDTFIPMLDDKQFPLLLNEAKALAFFELKQQPHQKAEKEINRQISALQKYKAEQSKPTDFFDAFQNYGRRGSGWL